MKMLDITRDRPVKIAVKVAVPVRDHPKVFISDALLNSAELQPFYNDTAKVILYCLLGFPQMCLGCTKVENLFR